MKFKENSSDKIINGIYKSGLSLILSYLLILISLNLNLTSNSGHFISVLIFIIGNSIKYVSLIYILRFICSLLYKILKKINV